ncbi:penicillin-insensitive murein endopeptidase, partial [Vibrio sp. D173a]|uniref:penicillin-insensitive murein endopeptidase n=1 Tax=Vibrio sp. D173a TaxID=2836349 RepID=UPI00256AA66B|nr:penicillin-insensitive murein endopeptidase [Vibrio sp. D173a]
MQIKWGSLLFLLCMPVLAAPTQWEGVDSPTKNPTNPIGSYANGCLDGAQALPLDGIGYQVIRPQRKRYYGHTDAIKFVQTLGKMVNDNLKRTLMVGDISLPRGGRFSSGHSSHQTGLDIDIWLRLNDRRLSLNQLAVPTPLSVVDLK